MIVGLTGPNAAGKGEACRILAARGYTLHSLSDVVREAARAEGRDVSRETLIEIGQRLRRDHGPGVLAERLLDRLPDPLPDALLDRRPDDPLPDRRPERPCARVAVDSIRAPAEVEVLRRRAGFFLLGVDAPIEVRWQRAVARGREGDAPALETFRAREERENSDRPDGQQLRRTLALADAIVVNDGGLDQLRQRVIGVLERWEALCASP